MKPRVARAAKERHPAQSDQACPYADRRNEAQLKQKQAHRTVSDVDQVPLLLFLLYLSVQVLIH